MSHVAIPLSIILPSYSREKAVAELKACGADRVFLIGYDVIPSIGDPQREVALEVFAREIPFYKEQGFEVGVWFWSFMRETDPSGALVPITGHDGKTTGCNYCPSCQGLIDDTCDFFRRIAGIGPDIIMFDDDYRYSWLGTGAGCYCPNHMKMVEEKVGERLTREDLHRKIYAGGENKYRSAWLDAMGSSLMNFARQIRRAVDEVDPTIRIALCSVLSLWDTDGASSADVVTALAGNTRPLLRLSGAPYWDGSAFFTDVRLQNIIEQNRLETAWCDGKNIEIMTEGDTFPRPRFSVPSSTLEIFDSSLRCAGVGEGILKYMFEYTSSLDYEHGYIDRHKRNQPFYDKIGDVFSDGEYVGVRVYEELHKFRQADFTGIDDPDDFASKFFFFSIASRFLSDNSVPTVYQGRGTAGIAFGENARHLDKEALQNGLFLDVRAAKILTEMGVDVGVTSFGEEAIATKLHYRKEDEDVSPNGSSAKSKFVRLTVSDKATVLCDVRHKDEEATPYAYAYENADGQRFIVFGFDSVGSDAVQYRSYSLQRLLLDGVEYLSGKRLPVEFAGNPDCYILCKKVDGGLAVGIWNCHADEILPQPMLLDREYTAVECVRASAALDGKALEVGEIPAHGFAMFRLTE